MFWYDVGASRQSEFGFARTAITVRGLSTEITASLVLQLNFKLFTARIQDTSP